MASFRPCRQLLGRTAAVLAALAATAVVAAAAPAAADTDTDPATAAVSDDPEVALAERFAPVVQLVEQEQQCGPGEPYAPSDVDVMFDNSSVALRGPWTYRDLVKAAPSVEDVAAGLPGYALDLPGDPLDPGCTYEKWADAQWGKKSEPTVYARVATQAGHEGRLALQYFFFYPFNDYNNKHETDWERIQLEFDAPDAATALESDPVRAVYSQHYGAEYAEWGEDKLEIADDTHPVVYVSAGSHANQFSAGVFMGNSASLGFGCDTTVGPHVPVRPVVKTIPSDQQRAETAYPWITYRGHWGEVGPRRFYEGPTGPNRKQSWTKPFTWSAGARSASFEVPGAGVVGSQAADTYCSVVGVGSDLFRRYVANPLGVLAGLAVALAATSWLLRRTSWETTELPLVLRRSAGQVTTASWRMFRSHLGLFLRIGVPVLAVEVTATVAQSFLFLAGAPSWWRVLMAALGVAVLLPAAAATVDALGRIDAGEAVTARSAYARSWRRALVAAPPMVVAGVVVLSLLGSLVLMPVALLLVTGWTLLVPMVVLDRVGGFTALWRSLVLARRSWRSILPVAVLGLLTLTSVGALLAALLFVVYPAPFVILNSLPPLVFALAWPLIAIASTYCYATATSAGPRPAFRRAAVDVPG